MNTPWRAKQRPAGDWAVDRLDNGRTVRHGLYPTEEIARTTADQLNSNWAQIVTSRGGAK